MFGLVSKRKVMKILYDQLDMYKSYELMAKKMKLDDCEERSRLQAGAVNRAIERLEEELS